LGVTTTNGLQVLLPLAAVMVTQAGRRRGVSWGSQLQMAFQSTYHLQPCRLPKLDAGGASVGGSRLQMAFESSYHLQPCRLPKMDIGGASVGCHNYEWPSSLPTTCSHAGYPSWTLKECQLGVTTTNVLQVFLPPTVMPVTQAGRCRGIS